MTFFEQGLGVPKYGGLIGLINMGRFLIKKKLCRQGTSEKGSAEIQYSVDLRLIFRHRLFYSIKLSAIWSRLAFEFHLQAP